MSKIRQSGEVFICKDCRLGFANRRSYTEHINGKRHRKQDARVKLRNVSNDPSVFPDWHTGRNNR